VRELWKGELVPGTKMNYVFSARIQVDGTPAYYCITAEPHNELADESPADNKSCKEYSATTWIGDPYPNPASGQMQMDVILPVNADIELEISDNNGRRITSKTIKARRGLNQLTINLASFTSGTYYLRITTPDKDETRKFIVL
jgi:hypothetical protein